MHTVSISQTRVNWVTAPFILILHAVSIGTVLHSFILLGCWLRGYELLPDVSPFLFCWGALWVAVFFYFVTGIGVTIGYHRLLTHRGFVTPIWSKWAWGLAGMCSLEMSVPQWVAKHRLHHKKSDQDGDPHSPQDGWWWSHVGWLLVYFRDEDTEALIVRYAPDMMKDPFFAWWHRHYWLVPVLMALGIAGMGYAYGGWAGTSSFLLWAFFVRVVLVWNVTWFVNSAAHTFGYRNYETTDKSTNCWWVGFLAHGEGWHNNHHAYPTLAVHGHKWWEFDLSYIIIRFLRLIRLAKDVKDTIPGQSST